MFLKVDNVVSERMSSWRLFQATGVPAAQNARLPSCSLVLGTAKSPGTGGWAQVPKRKRSATHQHSENDKTNLYYII